MITVTAVYSGYRTFYDTINRGGHEQKVFVKLHEWNNVTDDKGNVIADVIETKDSKTYSDAAPIQWKKYSIRCSECNSKAIIRPSSCERIISKENNIPLIRDIIKYYRADIATKEETYKALEKFNQNDIIDYVIEIIEKQKQNNNANIKKD